MAEPRGSPGGTTLSIVTRRPVAITMIVLAAVVFGLVSLSKLPVDLLPEISYPTLTVRTAFDGAAPEDVEDRVSERIQEALSTLPGLVRSTSISRAETSDVVLEFDWGTEMTFAVQDVRDKLDAVFLPDAAERPLILRYDPNLDPVLRIGLALPEEAPLDAGRTSQLVHLRWIAEHRVKRELESLPGVAAVLVRGGLEEEVRVRVDPHRMAAQGFAPADLAQRLAAENLNASGGMIREGSADYLVRTLNEFADLGEIENLALERVGQATVRVRDVATVERTHAEREVISHLDGREAVEIAVYREAGANIVQLAEVVRHRLYGDDGQREFTAELEQKGEAAASWKDRDKTDYLAWRFRDEARFETLSDQSTFIAAAVKEVQSAAVLGALLAVVVIWVFLRQLAATLIIGVAIPISIVVTFAPMYISGVSLNIMSLGGLALGVGMLVDNAIVVLESITRCREEGDSLAAAAVRGVREVAGAIVASTLTTIAVFAPIVFVHGIAGQIFGDQALTVVTSLLVSLAVAVFFIPMLGSRPWLAGEHEVEGGADWNPRQWILAPRRLRELRARGGLGPAGPRAALHGARVPRRGAGRGPRLARLPGALVREPAAALCLRPDLGRDRGALPTAALGCAVDLVAGGRHRGPPVRALGPADRGARRRAPAGNPPGRVHRPRRPGRRLSHREHRACFVRHRPRGPRAAGRGGHRPHRRHRKGHPDPRDRGQPHGALDRAPGARGVVG